MNGKWFCPKPFTDHSLPFPNNTIVGHRANSLVLLRFVWKITSPGDLPASGFTSEDPQLVAGEDGVHRLQTGSPAINSAAGEFPMVAFDFDGQPRAEEKDKGADEFSEAPPVARMLSPKDVGPNARPAPTPPLAL